MLGYVDYAGFELREKIFSSKNSNGENFRDEVRNTGHVVQCGKALRSGRTVELAVFGQSGDPGKGKVYRACSLPSSKTSKEK